MDEYRGHQMWNGMCGMKFNFDREVVVWLRTCVCFVYCCAVVYCYDLIYHIRPYICCIKDLVFRPLSEYIEIQLASEA